MTEIRVPTLGESVTEATIGRWFKKAGDAVAVDEPLVELETDKVTIEVPAPSAGTLGDIIAKDGETVAVGALLGQINDGAVAAKPAAAPAAAAPAKAAAAPAPAAPPAAAAPAPAPKAPPSDAPLAPSRGQRYDHLAFGVADLDAWIAKLKGEGVTFLEGPYKLGDTRAVMIEGPSREVLELVEAK